MADPWESICLRYSGEVIEKFEDNFVSGDRLPDSQQYLESLGKDTFKFIQCNILYRLKDVLITT